MARRHRRHRRRRQRAEPRGPSRVEPVEKKSSFRKRNSRSRDGTTNPKSWSRADGAGHRRRSSRTKAWKSSSKKKKRSRRKRTRPTISEFTPTKGAGDPDDEVQPRSTWATSRGERGRGRRSPRAAAGADAIGRPRRRVTAAAAGATVAAARRRRDGPRRARSRPATPARRPPRHAPAQAAHRRNLQTRPGSPRPGHQGRHRHQGPDPEHLHQHRRPLSRADARPQPHRRVAQDRGRRTPAAACAKS